MPPKVQIHFRQRYRFSPGSITSIQMRLTAVSVFPVHQAGADVFYGPRLDSSCLFSVCFIVFLSIRKRVSHRSGFRTPVDRENQAYVLVFMILNFIFLLKQAFLQPKEGPLTNCQGTLFLGAENCRIIFLFLKLSGQQQQFIGGIGIAYRNIAVFGAHRHFGPLGL